MKYLVHLAVVPLVLASGSSLAQEVTPEAPAVTTPSNDDVVVELLYVGLSLELTDQLTTQVYAAYGIDDELGLGVFDVGYSFNQFVELGARYQYFGLIDGNDQHSVWGYLKGQLRLGSWQLDTRQVIEQRFNTSGVNERTRYRPRFRGSYFGEMSSHGFQLYASVEPILNLTDEDDNQISIAGGGFLQLSPHLLLNAFYQFTATETGPDFHFPGIGLLITLSPFKSPPPPDAETK